MLIRLQYLLFGAGLAFLSACSTTQQKDVSSAAITPLSDLNLVNVPIPEPLVKAQKSPYGLQPEQDCSQLLAEVGELDAILGPDLDAAGDESKRGLLERGLDSTSGAAVGAIQRTAEGVIPFRGWIRKLSGAERNSKRAAAAVTAGGLRRAFLKGVSAAKSCVQ